MTTESKMKDEEVWIYDHDGFSSEVEDAFGMKPSKYHSDAKYTALLEERDRLADALDMTRKVCKLLESRGKK